MEGWTAPRASGVLAEHSPKQWQPWFVCPAGDEASRLIGTVAAPDVTICISVLGVAAMREPLRIAHAWTATGCVSTNASQRQNRARADRDANDGGAFISGNIVQPGSLVLSSNF